MTELEEVAQAMLGNYINWLDIYSSTVDLANSFVSMQMDESPAVQHTVAMYLHQLTTAH